MKLFCIWASSSKESCHLKIFLFFTSGGHFCFEERNSTILVEGLMRDICVKFEFGLTLR